MPAVQQAYVYLVLAIAIHMVVLGVANLLRVGAEFALAAPSGGFTGLPFVFADALAQPRDLQREQLSLALALLAIGIPAWLIHWRIARRGIARDPSERASPLRSFYVNLVVFVTALLAFGYSANALNRALHEALGPFRFAQPGDPHYTARVAGALAMALAALVACIWHVRVGRRDRAALFIGGNAAVLRRLQSYGLAAIGLIILLASAAETLGVLWSWAWGSAVGFQPFPEPSFGPGRGPPPGLEEFRQEPLAELRRRLASSLPLVLPALPLWLFSWRAAQRTAGAREDEEERRSAVRKFALYVVTTISALVMLGALAFAVSRVLREALFVPELSARPLWEDVASPLSFAVAFGASWLFHRLAVEREVALEVERSAQAAIRRIYYYLTAAVSFLLLAVGAAGALGVTSSYLLDQQTHSAGEQSTYLALVIVGLPAWAFHWVRIQQRIWSGDAGRVAEERAAPQRRAFLYLAVFGGVVTMLVAGSAALYTILNGLLAQRFDTTLLHDVWHLVVDAGIGAAALLWHARILRSDRAALAPPAEAALGPRALVAIVRGDMTRERLVAALGASDVTVYETDEAAAAELARRLGAHRGE